MRLTRREWLHLALLWLGGVDLRVTVLAIPPVIPAIHHDLGLDEKGVSVLTGLPILLLAAAAIPGAVLIARLGARGALVTGLLWKGKVFTDDGIMVNRLAGGDLGCDLFQEPQKLLVTMTAMTRADHLAGGNVQSRK